jgi:hypothetical protein
MRYSSMGLSELANNVASSISGSYAFGYIKVDDSGVKRFIVGRAVSPLEEADADGARLFASVLPHPMKGKQIANGTFIDLLSGESIVVDSLTRYSYYVPGSYRLTDYIEVEPSKKQSTCIVDTLDYNIGGVDVEVNFIGSCGDDMVTELMTNEAVDVVINAYTDGCSARTFGSVVVTGNSVKFKKYMYTVRCNNKKTSKKITRAVDNAISKLLSDVRTMLIEVDYVS